MAEDDRRDRLAAALRANLKRRKQPGVEAAAAQTRGAIVGTGEGSAEAVADDQRHSPGAIR